MAVVAMLLVLVPLALMAWFVVFMLRDARENERHKRMPLGLCPNCGYDLRACQGVCPECGRQLPFRCCTRCGGRIFYEADGPCPHCGA